MNLRQFFTRRRIGFLIALFLVLAGFSIFWIHYLQIAHSSFENYYKFRGCVELVEKTDTYATCKLDTGEIIKIVKFDNKWFLDGDL